MSCAFSVQILEQALSPIRQGKWLFVSLSNFVIPMNQLQNSQDVCRFRTMSSCEMGGTQSPKTNTLIRRCRDLNQVPYWNDLDIIQIYVRVHQRLR
jgi:hypothetical protein